jgi:hypothetical protein
MEQIHPIQAMVDGMNAASMRERAQTQMTLGKLIERLEAMPADTLIDGLHDEHSYRGYYSDLAFTPCAERVSAGALLALCCGAMGQVYEGYKGGDFVMGARTPVWIANYGDCGRKLMAIRDDGTLETAGDTFD